MKKKYQKPELSMKDDEVIELANRQMHEAFTRESDPQTTFSPPDHQVVAPIIEEIQSGTARAFVVAVETRDGIKVWHKTNGSGRLVGMLNGD